MIFGNVDDIQSDIYNRIILFLKNNTDDININHIKSLLETYIIELKNIKEINNYSIIDDYSNNTIIIYILKNNECKYFSVDINLEIRKIKINKIRSSISTIKYFTNKNDYICFL